MLTFIGEIKTPYNSIEECPKNIDSNGPMCQLVIKKEYELGLNGLEKGHTILVLYWFDTKFNGELIQKRQGFGPEMGVFALRSPLRPNPIAASIVPIEKIEGNSIYVKGFDCLNGTKIVDIKRDFSEKEMDEIFEENRRKGYHDKAKS